MKHYIGFILTIFSIIFILNSGCSKESETLVPDIVTDTTYTDTTVVILDTLDNSTDSTDVAGCTDSTATNYNSLATTDDGSCQYAVTISGCTDVEADNYDAEATVDDSSCVYPDTFGCTDLDAENYDPDATLDDGSCEYPVQVTGSIGDIFNQFNDGSSFGENGTINNDVFNLFRGPEGVNIFIEPNVFETLSGNPVTGEVEISLIEVLTKGDMIRHRTPTFSNGQLLESGGMLNISATQNGEDLRLRPGRTINVQVPVSDNTVVTSEMDIFYGVENTEPLDWTIADSSNIFISEWEDSLGFGFGYELIAERLGWINCDYFYGESNLTDAAVSLGSGYSNQNTIVFMVFNDINSVAHMWGDANTMQFNMNNIPVGYEVTFVVIASLSEDENNPEYEFALVPATISPNHLEEITPMPASIEEIEAALDGL